MTALPSHFPGAEVVPIKQRDGLSGSPLMRSLPQAEDYLLRPSGLSEKP